MKNYIDLFISTNIYENSNTPGPGLDAWVTVENKTDTYCTCPLDLVAWATVIDSKLQYCEY